MSDEQKGLTKAERQRQVEERVNAALPSVDIGQFERARGRGGVPLPPSDVERAVRVAERIVWGAQLRDACLIEGAPPAGYLKALKRYRRAERIEEGDIEEGASTDVAREGTWTYALGFTLDRANALCRLRWQMLAEAGGKGSSTALWMLERRGGRGYLPAVRREQVTSTTTTTTTETQVTLTLEASLADTQQRLGLSEDALAQMGEWLSRAQTASQRGSALPPPPQMIDVTPTEGGDE